MTFEEASKKYKLPIKVLHRLQELGLISGNPLTEDDIHAVEIVSSLYGDMTLLRAQLAKFDRATREDLVSMAELAKWERYVVNRYRNHIARKSGGRLYVQQVADEIRRYYGIEKTNEVIKRIYQLRKRTYKELARKTGSISSRPRHQGAKWKDEI
jgi:hypothetical protein